MTSGGYGDGFGGVAEGRPFPGGWVAAAVVATLFFPVISLIVALVLVGAEADPVRKRSLRTWAMGSAAFFVLQILVAIALFTSVSSTVGTDESGECFGGPRMDVAAAERPDGTAVFPCEGGGSVTIDFSEDAPEEVLP